MQVTKIKLHPFAGANNLEVLLKDGLNVVYGPNEAGKSTILNAIQFAFFSPPWLGKKSRSDAAIFFPATGGDTIRVTIDFNLNGSNYTLGRSWGGTEFTSLKGKDIGEITDPETALEKLHEFLSVNQASWEGILFSQQAKISDAFQKLTEIEIRNSFGDIIRKSVASGNLSIDSFKMSLANVVDSSGSESYFSNWDDIANRPIGGRDLDNPWRKNVGFILAAYYQLKEAEHDLIIRKMYDDSFDQYSLKLSELNSKINQLKTFLTKNSPIIEDANHRRILEAKNKERRLQLNKYSQDKESWDLCSSSLKAKGDVLKTLKDEPKKLNDELNIAILKESIKDIKLKIKQADEISQKVENLQKELKKKTIVLDQDVEIYEELTTELRGLSSELKSHKLVYTIKAKSDVAYLIKKGTEGQKTIKLKGGQAASEEVSGQFRIETDDLIVSVESAMENIPELMKKISKVENDLGKIGKRFGINTLKDLKVLFSESTKLSSEIANQKKLLNVILVGNKLEALKQDVSKIESLPSVRPSKKISEEINDRKTQLKLIEADINRFNETVSQFCKTYHTLKELSERQLAVGVELEEIKRKMAALKPLPPYIKDLDAFVNEFNSKKVDHDNLKEKLTEIMVHKAQLIEPDFTSEELKEKIGAFKNEFELKKQEGKAYKKISEVFNSIVAEESKDVFQPFTEKLTGYFDILTGGKYSNVTVDEIIPSKIGNSQKSLPVSLLSKGTKDSLALAQRISMAGYYLKDSRGFLVLDDPLTDMDPSRKAAAVSVITEFAKEKQLIFFTCDPVHAKMFDVKEITLN